MPDMALDADMLAKLDEAALTLCATWEDLLNQSMGSFMARLADKADYEQWFIRKFLCGLRPRPLV